MTAVPSQEELEAACCWEADDRVPRRPAMTEFRRRARYHQAQWRERHGHPMGTQPMQPRPGRSARPVGSRLPLAYAQETGANFVTPGALAAARARLANKEPHQSLDRQRLWADLLWSTPFACNLFGDLAADLDLADRAVHTWWPDVPGVVRDVRFVHSPGWLDPDHLGNLISWEAAFLLEQDDGALALVALATRYHDRSKGLLPKPERLARYLAVTERSGAFHRDRLGEVTKGELLVLWLQHALVLSVLQHPSGEFAWGRLVVVHPAGNVDVADECARYRSVLADRATFASMTLEDLLAAGALPPAITAALRDRYVVDRRS